MPRCEHEYLEREQGGEEAGQPNDGFIELICARCDDYQVARSLTANERAMKGGSGDG